MQNENLLVNSKTDILEFKRKHNLLVGKGSIKTTVSNIKQMSNVDIENLSCGDVVLKEDASGKHAYLVSFKSATGLCLTYCDASCVETQSYDKVGENWQYNSQDLSFINRIEQIVDKDGHERFIEGDIELLNNVPVGVTKIYGKWSLCGSHLMIVLAFSITNGTELAGTPLAEVNLPEWIVNKIYPIQSERIEYTNFLAFASNLTSQNVGSSLTKVNNKIIINASITANSDKACRMAYDLLIDNE